MGEVDENADTFGANAAIKALAAQAHTGHISLSDDSGIEVEALEWGPGIRSARYAPGTDADRVCALLAAMEGKKLRTARFTCAIAVAGLDRITADPMIDACEDLGDFVTWISGCLVVHGRVEGTITHEPRGQNGFGYDPIFELSDGRTTAEISAEEKRSISHRGCAARRIRPFINTLFSLTP
jgi:XTP/dITP diphosphohydrolase